MTVLASHKWGSNGALIADAVVPLGYLRPDWRTLDATFGLGRFWTKWRPDILVGVDLDPAKSDLGPVDFTALPFRDQAFHATVLDPPYKLNGTPSKPDERYGVDVVAGWQARHHLINRGIVECARVTEHVLLVKCQSQVCGGKVRWQTYEFVATAAAAGFGLRDEFDMTGHVRPQPMAGRTQRTAHGRPSTLLVLQRGWDPTR